jgi:hypothetical protein
MIGGKNIRSEGKSGILTTNKKSINPEEVIKWVRDQNFSGVLAWTNQLYRKVVQQWVIKRSLLK